MLKEMTIKIITEQDEQFFDSLIRERLFGYADISDISFENIDPDWNDAHNKHKGDCSKCPMIDHCEDAKINIKKLDK